MSGRLEEYGIDPNTNERLRVIRETVHRNDDKLVYHVNPTGKKHGTYRQYGSNNILLEQIIYKDGVMNGPVTSYNHLNGKIWKETSYLNGKEHGHRKLWFADGKLAHTSYYSNGNLDGEMTDYYINGTMMRKVNYVEGKLCGLYQCWNSDGKLTEEKNFSVLGIDIQKS